MQENRHGKGHFDENDYKRGIAINGLAGVFALMFLGLLASAGAAFFTLSSPTLLNLVFSGGAATWIILLAPLGLVIFAFPRVWKMAPASAFLLFFVYAILNGLTLSAIFLVYDMGTITLAFLSAAGMFGVMAIYGGITKADLSGMGSFLMMGLFGIIIASVLNIFLGNDMMDMLISYAGIAIFLGLTAYDVQRLKHAMSQSPGNAGVMVLGALHLYLDFLNIFLFLLRLMGRRR